MATEVVPCITKSSQIRQSVFGRADYDDLVRNDAPVLLFSVSKTHSRTRGRLYSEVGSRGGIIRAF